MVVCSYPYLYLDHRCRFVYFFWGEGGGAWPPLPNAEFGPPNGPPPPQCFRLGFCFVFYKFSPNALNGWIDNTEKKSNSTLVQMLYNTRLELRITPTQRE